MVIRLKLQNIYTFTESQIRQKFCKNVQNSAHDTRRSYFETLQQCTAINLHKQETRQLQKS